MMTRNDDNDNDDDDDGDSDDDDYDGDDDNDNVHGCAMFLLENHVKKPLPHVNDILHFLEE